MTLVYEMDQGVPDTRDAAAGFDMSILSIPDILAILFTCNSHNLSLVLLHTKYAEAAWLARRVEHHG